MIGIDVSKLTLQCAYRDPKTRDLVWEKEYPNTQSGIMELLKRTPAGCSWTMEPTGRYSSLAALLAQQSKQAVLLAPTRRAKAFLNSIQDRAKTDKVDAKGLALYGMSVPLAPFLPKEAVMESIDQLHSARKGLVTSRSKLQQQANELPVAREALLVAVEHLTAQIKVVDKEIASCIAAEPRLAVVKELLKVPGIGPVTASAIASRLAGKSFSHPDKFVAYIGLDVSVHQSGKRKGERGLTHQGDAELRRLLYCCAQSSLRGKASPFKAQYERERAKGLSATGALCAVARKLAKLCWSLHKHGTAYDPSRVYTVPAGRESKTEENSTLSATDLDNRP